MKVLFTFGGIPHYLNAMLNRLQAKGVEITVVSPKKGNTTIGKGVKMVEGGTYKHLTTPEKKMFYGKSAFPALPEIIAEEKDGAKDTPLTILQRLIDRQVSEEIQGRTCCLETNGGKQDVRTSST